MCYPDINPHPYYWTGDKYHPVSISAKVTRKCVDWKALQKTLEPRNFPYSDMIEGTGPLNWWRTPGTKYETVTIGSREWFYWNQWHSQLFFIYVAFITIDGKSMVGCHTLVLRNSEIWKLLLQCYVAYDTMHSSLGIQTSQKAVTPSKVCRESVVGSLACKIIQRNIAGNRYQVEWRRRFASDAYSNWWWLLHRNGHWAQVLF